MNRRFRLILLAFSAVSVYLWLRADPTMFYYGLVLAHVVGGVALTAYVTFRLPAAWRGLHRSGRVGWLLLLAGAILGSTLIATGNFRPMRGLLWSHEIAASLGAAVLLLAKDADGVRSSERGRHRASREMVAAAGIASLCLLGAYADRGPRSFRIGNPHAPTSMDGESMGGKEGPFFPSSIHTTTKGRIPSTFFMTSESCGRAGCHPDTFKEWQSSMHRFSSFNNQFYRKSVEYMQDVVGVRPSKWCAGCHDVAVLLNGMFEKPIGAIVKSPEATVGLACTACHSVIRVGSTMGNGDYEIEYPPLHDLAVSKSPLLSSLHDFLVRMDPEPHRRTFLKPFHRQQSAEFCSSCHKVHLDAPVNHYRWFRGFNDYDAWQASGVSHQGARSFYAPPEPKRCVDCHMPLRESADKGSIGGKGHSHRFAAANTAVPTANQDEAQLQAVREFITGRAVSVDIFAASLAKPTLDGGGAAVPASAAANFFGAGEEEAGVSPGTPSPSTDFSAMLAPLDRVASPVLPRGGSVRLDVVVRTTGLGHFFPGGTVDAFDVWVELRGVDAAGRTIYWSGAVEDDGKGPVEKGAHFYKALLIDASGNPIDKRNAWAARALVYSRLIPPGAADTARFRVSVPPDVASPVTFSAKVNYRKFSHFYTTFSYALRRDPTDLHPDKTPDYDNGRFEVGPVPDDVSGKVKEIPRLPILVLAETSVTLRVGEPGEVAPQLVMDVKDKIRWNDYGIGLYLERDLRGAALAWERVTEIDPSYADGFVNRGRAALDEGRVAEAAGYVREALKIDPGFPKAHYFAALADKTYGDYEGALAHLRVTLAKFPRDRVVRDEAGRVLFLLRRYEDAVKELEQTLAIDPEDLQAHYNLMLCYGALGRRDEAATEEKLYLRFKADEASQALTGDYLRRHPEDNNERQRIHEHVSIPLAAGHPARAALSPGGAPPASPSPRDRVRDEGTRSRG